MSGGDPPEVHYLTVRPFGIACQPERKGPDAMTGAPLNTTIKTQVTCEACKEALQ